MASTSVKKCGVQFEPPALIFLYSKGQDMRRKTIPLRNFSNKSDISTTVNELYSKDRYKDVVNLVPKDQLKRLVTILRNKMNGITLGESLDSLKKETEQSNLEKKLPSSDRNSNIDLSQTSQEDLNKASDEYLAIRKAQMNETFQKNQKKKDDVDFQYDVEVEFEPQKNSEWDSESEHSF